MVRIYDTKMHVFLSFDLNKFLVCLFCFYIMETVSDEIIRYVAYRQYGFCLRWVIKIKLLIKWNPSFRFVSTMNNRLFRQSKYLLFEKKKIHNTNRSNWVVYFVLQKFRTKCLTWSAQSPEKFFFKLKLEKADLICKIWLQGIIVQIVWFFVGVKY